MDPGKTLPLTRKLLKHYYFFNWHRILIILIVITIITGSIYYCLSCGTSEMIQGFRPTSQFSDESDEDYDRKEPFYSVDWETEDEIVIDHIFYTRRIYLQQKCRELNIQQELNLQKFIINREQHLIYCNIFGAAPPKWLYYLNLLTKSDEDYLTKSRIARERNPAVEFNRLTDYFLSFIVVRHPYDRLINIYINQFILNSHNEWFKEIGEQIILSTRVEVEKDRFEKIRKFEYPPTFEEFVRFILCQWKDNRTIYEHWLPATTFCTPCEVNFQLILKFETIEDETPYLEERAGLVNMKNATESTIITKPVSAEEMNESMKKYLSQLSKQEIIEIYEYYKKDFELFGYSPGEYLSLGREIHTSPRCLKHLNH